MERKGYTGRGDCRFLSFPGRRRGGFPRLRLIILATVVSVIVTPLLPLLAAGPPEPPMPSTTYGVLEALTALQATMRSLYNSPALLREAHGAIDAIQPLKMEKVLPSLEYELVEPEMPSFTPPGIFTDAESNTDLNGTSILEWLLQGPLNYWVSTLHGGLRTWSRGSLRPTLDFRVDESGVHIVDWERWVEVDADGNLSTGNASGSELRARLSVTIENYTFERPHLVSIIPPEFSDWQFNFSGGIRAEIERLAGPAAPLPVEVSFLKSFTYQGLNYIWIISLNFTDLPQRFEASVTADKVNTHGSLREILGELLQNFTLGNASLIGDISGPYNISISTGPLDSLSMMLGYAKAVSRSLVERSWLRIDLSTAPGFFAVPEKMSVWLDSPAFNMPFNHLRWSADAPCRVEAEVSVDRGNLTYGTLSIQSAPESMVLRLDNASAEGNYARFEASARIARFEYNEWEFYSKDRSEYKHMHVLLTDVPTLIEFRGTFEVGGASPLIINNEPGMGLVARLIDSVMVRFAGKFATIARTLRSIPENVLRMPERDGWVSLSMPQEQRLGGLELWLASGPYILREGNFLSFYNLSLPTSAGSVMNISFSARLSGLAGLDGDFRNGTFINLRSSTKQGLTALFVDEPRRSNATLEVLPLPSVFVLEQSPSNRTLRVSTSESIERLVYTGWVREHFLGISVEGLPESISVRQSPEELVIETPPERPVERLGILATDSELYSLRGNHIVVRSGGGGTSFGASFSGLTRLGLATGENGRVELGLRTDEPLRVYIDNTTEDFAARLVIDPMPAELSLGMGTLLGGWGLEIPDLMGATSIVGFSTAVFAVTELGEDILNVAERISGFIEEQVSGLGRNSTIIIRALSDTTLIGDIQRGRLVEAPWVHGIASRQLQPQGRNTTCFSTRLFLRLGRETSLSSRSEGDELGFSIAIKGFHPRHDWMALDMENVAGRDILAYLTGLPSALDLSINGTVSQNATYGREVLAAGLALRASSALGPFLVSLSRLPPMSTRFLAFGSALPEEMDVRGCMGERVGIDYKATSNLEHLFIKNSRLVRDFWRSSTVLLHQLPLSLNASLDPPPSFEARDPPTQILPELSLQSDRADLDIFIDLDGRATGQRSSYQVEVKDAGRVLSARHSGGFYRIRSDGVEELYLRVRDLPYREGLRIRALGLYAEALKSLDLGSSLVFGSYPTFSLCGLSADTLQLSVRTSFGPGGGDGEGRLVLLDSRSRGPLPLGMQLFSNGLALGASRGDDHLLVPLPVASLLWSLLGG
ncbi:MAG: hypothetical protein QW379_05895 [Thermoplasmata archaeon]